MRYRPLSHMVPVDRKMSFAIKCALLCAWGSTSVIFATSPANSNNIPDLYQGSPFNWGLETNELRAGLVLENEVHGLTRLTIADVVLLTTKTNAVWDYVKPPSEKLARCELRNSKGMVIQAVPGEELDGELAPTISLKDLPMVPKFGRNNSLPKGALTLFRDQAKTLKRFPVQDTYKIEESGTYTLTVWPAVYLFSTNRQFLTRIDLPQVSMTIYLDKQQ